MQNTICLCMIVKNESKIINRLLNSVVDIIDYISICDTGSTDNTPELIYDFGVKNNIPTIVHTYTYISNNNDNISEYNNNKSHKLPNGFTIIQNDNIYQLLYNNELIYQDDDIEFKINAPNKIINKLNLNGNLKTEWFLDFGHNRTNSLFRAKESFPNATYLLLLDADMILNISPNFNKILLIEDCHELIQERGKLRYKNIRIVKSSINWKYFCRTHEYISSYEKHNKFLIDSLYIIDVNDGGYKKNKYERDIKLLTLDINENIFLTRSYFYRSNTFFCLCKYNDAINDYNKRINIGGGVP